MTLLYLGIIVVLLQSYIRLQYRYKNLVNQHVFIMEDLLKDISEIKNKCKKDKKSE
jgi:predicted membrane chloride channel (bestrophin family)